jgi:hypothetical protein
MTGERISKKLAADIRRAQAERDKRAERDRLWMEVAKTHDMRTLTRAERRRLMDDAAARLLTER